MAKNAFEKGKEKGRDLVTGLDPDAPTRQGRQIEEEDEDEERFLMRIVWAFVRKGDIRGARDLCEEVGYLWRVDRKSWPVELKRGIRSLMAHDKLDKART
ncbi:Nucleoporin nup84 [Rhizina undulata]